MTKEKVIWNQRIDMYIEELFPHVFIGVSFVELEDEEGGDTAFVISIGLVFWALNIFL